MSDFEQCPFCARVFPTDAYPGMVHHRPMLDHVQIDHGKVRFREGSTYRWVDRSEIEGSSTGSDPSQNPGR